MTGESRCSKKGTRDGRYGQLLHGMPLNGTRSIRAIVHHRERIRYRPFIRTLEWATSGSEFAPGGCTCSIQSTTLPFSVS